tara:strand:+ start:4078 stop:4647 length:570 start_codon:yes stop_codon:yes gene_type:complete
MKVFYTATFLLFFNTLYSKPISNTLRCLGEEEQRYHNTKNTGALYHLNQSLISFFGVNPGSIFNDKAFNSCPDIPSYYFIKAMLTDPNQYIITTSSTGDGKDPRFENQIKFNLLSQLLGFLNKTQQKNDLIECLENKSENYKKIKFQLFYLQENINKFELLIPKEIVLGLYNDITKISLAQDCTIPMGL